MLVAVYPDEKADLDATFVTMLAGVAEGEPKTKGVDLGKKAAGRSLLYAQTMEQTLRKAIGRTPAQAFMSLRSYPSFQRWEL